jgi:toxin-antitoxin system PIN domain toxin
MILLDVNVLVDAFRGDQPRHPTVRTWIDQLVEGDAAFAVPELVLSGFVRIVTHPRVFHEPDDVDDAFAFAERLRALPHAVMVGPGERHWSLFARLCRVTRATGNLVPDAYLAAMAIESGSELITADRGFARFPGLRWREPVPARANS